MAFLLRQAVECRLRSAFPVASHLSGGLDSSAVSIVAARVERGRGRQLAAYSWSPPVRSFEAGSEYARIDAICRQERLVCEYVPATVQSLTETFRRDFTVEPVSMMAREANVQEKAEARGVRVLLSGWGGDEAATIRSAGLPGLLAGDLAAFRDVVSQRIANAGLFRKVRRLAGVVRELAILHLPDSLYGLTANPFLMHRAPCIQPAFAQQCRREVEELRGAAWRNLPELRATIRRRLETGHIPMRLEHWAAGGAGHGLVYRYPMLDKRLVEFALGVPVGQLYRPGVRQTLLERAIVDSLPPAAEWQAVKVETRTLAALKGEYFRAHSEWAAHLLAEMPDSPATRFVDPKKIQQAVRMRTDSEQIASLSGVREAFGCYAIGAKLKL
jgi:asparagine synthase (glutamine-hydrolysing)